MVVMANKAVVDYHVAYVVGLVEMVIFHGEISYGKLKVVSH